MEKDGQMNLGIRLQAVAGIIPESCRRVADIGADHALLPIYLLQAAQADYAVAGELRRGPFLRARQAVREAGLADVISVRSGNGLEVLSPGEVEAVVLAGLGGDVIRSVLSSPLAASFTRFIIQPMSRAYKIRQFLAQQGWAIVQERLVKENQKYYTVMLVQTGGRPYELDELQLELGPVILQQKDQLAQEYFTYLYEKNVRLRLHLSHSRDNKTQLEQLVAAKLKALEEIIDGSSS
jgi:tRNA (adenine22-N1)-methyltransferase